ncbi:response regulator transcription factor [Faecalimonas canis]
MIIDDEPIIVEGLSKSISWEKWNCEVVATANDGYEGRELIQEYKPNMIFCDISMPELDGLTMIAGLKSEFEDMEISILTGYRDFDYAQQAVNLGVTRFLLKPSSMKEIEEAVETMTENLKKKHILVEPHETANSFIVKNAMKYIDEHYNEKLTLPDVAEKTYVSQWHLSKLLNKEMKKSFSEILNDTRIKRAKKLLEDSSLRIGDVAREVGFLDFAHFSRVFKKVEGISANEYRNHMD